MRKCCLEMTAKYSIKAIITDKRGRVLSIGENSYHKSHPLQAMYAEKAGEDYKIFLHAEIMSIVRCKDLSKAHTISVFRYNKQGRPMLAKPCKICQSAIEAAGIKNIVYTTEEI